MRIPVFCCIILITVQQETAAQMVTTQKADSFKAAVDFQFVKRQQMTLSTSLPSVYKPAPLVSMFRYTSPYVSQKNDKASNTILNLIGIGILSFYGEKTNHSYRPITIQQ
jgi:hypothetical protein